MKFCIVGAGAIGGWIAARLALAGEDVSVLARGATLAKLQREGIELRSAGRSERVRVRAEGDAAALGAHDVIIAAVKAPALPPLAPALRTLLQEGSVLLSAANGLPWWYFQVPGVPCHGLRLTSVDAEGALETLPFGTVLGLSVFAACHAPEPGVIVNDAGQRLVLGEPAGGTSARAETLAQRLQRAGFDAQLSTDIRRDIWLKLLGNACFNPVSLLTGAHSDTMIDDPKLHTLFVRMMDEAIGVGGRLGVAHEVDPLQRIAQSRRLGHIKTSMLQDAEAGRAPEVDAILGALVESAGAVAMPVPTLDAVLGLARLRARTLVEGG
jgi:2-dehydropantoate 2-reductase